MRFSGRLLPIIQTLTEDDISGSHSYTVCGNTVFYGMGEFYLQANAKGKEEISGTVGISVNSSTQ